MKFVSLMDSSSNLNHSSLATQIMNTMHDGLNNSCINYLDFQTLKNRLGMTNSKKLRATLKNLIRHRKLKMTCFRGQNFFSL